MAEPRRAPETVKGCDIEGCVAEAKRSIPGKKVDKAGMKLASDPDKNARLCREHYKEYKKRTKKDRTLERLHWGT